jgi:hypothetical protein
MPRETGIDSRKETPIERIFKKVMRRKMTAREKICFHLNNGIKPTPQNGASSPSHPKPPQMKATRP